ncbi:MAG: hypothetical protein ACTSQ3_04975, partial [Candidatus Heimdallarchaeota archaeon]
YDLSRQNIYGTNGSQQGYYDLRAPLYTWTHVTRNVTDDLVQAVSLLPDLSTAYVRYFYMIVSSPNNPTGDTILLMDDVSFTNSTNFNYFADNGDFEDGDSNPWYDEGSGPGTVYLTEDDKTQGNSAMNMTAYSQYSFTRSYAYADKDMISGWFTMPKGYPVYQPGDLTISFDWKYSDMANGLGQQTAYFYISAQNETFSVNYRYYLGDEHDVVPYSNYTTASYASYYFAAEGLGTRDVWNELTFDYYTLLSETNLTGLPLYYIGYYIEADDADDLTVQLLVDDFQFVTCPAGDTGFEGDFGFNPSDPIKLWATSMNDNYVNITTDAYSGNFAANVSSYTGSGDRYCYRRTFFPITNNLFTDFWWRLDKLSSSGGTAYSHIRLQLDDTNLMYYILGSKSITFTNSSNTCYYFVDDCNQTGTWNNLFRNLTADVAYFGAGTHNITQIYLGSYALGSSEVVTIFDDIHFATDVTGPTLDNLGLTPPLYGEPVTIQVIAADNIALDRIDLHYSIDSGSWISLPMSPNGAQFAADIPAQDYDTFVEYYIDSEDIYGHETTLGSEISPYSYFVFDPIDPVLTVEVPLETETLAGSIPINITDAYDLGSGIDNFFIRIDNEVVYNEIGFPLIWVFHTNDYTNDIHTLTITLTDVAGNFVEYGFEYTIYNPPTNWEAFSTFMQKWGPYIGGGAGGLAIIVVVLVVVLRRKKGI